MTDKEAQTQAARIAKFRELEGIRERTQMLLNEIVARPADPRIKSPFTSDHNDSRQIRRIKIDFTAPLAPGGPGPANLTMDLNDLFIPASDIGRELERLIRANLATVTKAIAEL